MVRMMDETTKRASVAREYGTMWLAAGRTQRRMPERMIVATTAPMATETASSTRPRAGRMRYSPCTANALGKTSATSGSSSV
jgi:hypothetical protein